MNFFWIFQCCVTLDVMKLQDDGKLLPEKVLNTLHCHYLSILFGGSRIFEIKMLFKHFCEFLIFLLFEQHQSCSNNTLLFKQHQAKCSNNMESCSNNNFFVVWTTLKLFKQHEKSWNSVFFNGCLRITKTIFLKPHACSSHN